MSLFQFLEGYKVKTEISNFKKVSTYGHRNNKIFFAQKKLQSDTRTCVETKHVVRQIAIACFVLISFFVNIINSEINFIILLKQGFGFWFSCVYESYDLDIRKYNFKLFFKFKYMSIL